MKIEKISDTQIKFILTQNDLNMRNLKIEELIQPTEKTQALFRDIMEQAMNECGFKTNDVPLMVEAVPVALDGVMVIVTKLQEDITSENKTALIAQNKGILKFKRKPIAFEEPSESRETCILVYSFNSLDDIIDLSNRLYNTYNGTNSLYKYINKYFLVLQNDMITDNIELDDLEVILGEYGQKHVSNVLSKYYLVEHGELILKNSAIKVLAKNLA